MNFLSRIFMFLKMVVTGQWGFFNNYVMPVIAFIDFIKDVLNHESEIELDEANYQNQFQKILGTTKEFVAKICAALFKSIKELELGLEIDDTKHITLYIAFIAYLKPKSKIIKAMILFKLASLMVKHMLAADNHEISTHEADTYVQIAYAHNRHQKTV